MVADGITTARSMLDRFEVSIATRDLSTLILLCSEQVVLFGSAQANFGPEETTSYLGRVMEANSVRWVLDQWAILHHDDTTLLAAAVGHVETDDGSTLERSAFRLTLWLIREGEDWKLGHFHGSLPAS
jgi:ketosteroid isomerase-like protein